MGDEEQLIPHDDRAWLDLEIVKSEVVKRVRAQTPARLLRGRSGAAYRTNTQLELREAHAAARDAVRAELDIRRDLGDEFIQAWGLFEVRSQAASKDEYLLRPELGRQLEDATRTEVARRCPANRDLQIVVGDGLSVTAIAKQVPNLLPLLHEGAMARGWSVGQVFVVRHCRVGILNDVGELLTPNVAVLLIGERPGLATAESLSAYMAYRPETSNTDAERNLISNIHGRGVGAEQAAQRILSLAAAMMKNRKSGCELLEEVPGIAATSAKNHPTE